MQPKHNKQLVPLAKQLRKEMTKEERRLTKSAEISVELVRISMLR